MTKRKQFISKAVTSSFISYYNALKCYGKPGDLKNLADFCGISAAYLSRIASGHVNLPIEVAAKTVIFSKGKLNLSCIAPYLQKELPIIARLEILHEMKIPKEKKQELINSIFASLNSGDTLPLDDYEKFLNFKEIVNEE